MGKSLSKAVRMIAAFGLTKRDLNAPDSESEIERVQMAHHVFLAIWGNNFSSPVKDILQRGGARVLDVGTGPGTWTCDCASDYPQSQFAGVDLVEVFPKQCPFNTSFHKASAVALPFPDNSFDFVFMRFLSRFLTKDEWKRAIVEIIRVTKPGGWIEVMDGDIIGHVPPPLVKRLITTYNKRLNAQGVPYPVRPLLQGLLSSTFELGNVHLELRTSPCGSWSGDKVGKWTMELLIEPLLGSLVISGDVNAKDKDDYVRRCHGELSSHQMQFNHYRYYAQKTKEPSPCRKNEEPVLGFSNQFTKCSD